MTYVEPTGERTQTGRSGERREMPKAKGAKQAAPPAEVQEDEDYKSEGTVRAACERSPTWRVKPPLPAL